MKTKCFDFPYLRSCRFAFHWEGVGGGGEIERKSQSQRECKKGKQTKREKERDMCKT